MSEKTSDNAGNVTALPQFMKERNQAPVEIEEKTSWLNNNLHKLMVSVSIVWFAIVLIYITQFFGWSNLFLMMPDEFGGFLAGVTLPLAIIWVVMAYIDRGSSFKQEAKFLRAYMNQLVYPEDGAPQTAKAMADAIRSQVVELQQVSKLAHEQTSKIQDAIRGNVNDFAQLVAKLDNYSSKTVVELSDGVKFLMANFENILNKAQASSQNLAQINQEFLACGNGIEDSIVSLYDKMLPRLQEIKTTTSMLKEITDSSSAQISKANEGLHSFTEKTDSSLSTLQEMLLRQAGSLQQISESAVANSNLIKSKVATEIATMDHMLHEHASKVGQVLAESGKELKDKTDETVKAALSNISTINNNLKNGMSDVDNSVNRQIQKIDEALAKHNKEISSFIKALDDKADGVNRKFSAHGDLIAQELDRLMVRGANLEEAIAMRVSNLNQVSDQAIAAMQNIETALANNINSLDQKAAAANDDIVSYTDSLQEKTVEFERISSDSIDRIVTLTEILNNRYADLQKALANGLGQLQEADKGINASTENLLVQTAQSTESLNSVSELMKKHTHGLTEASSIVVTQSQISEVSLAQQQKHITDTAARVEEIKNELKRQIDELSSASGTLEKDAVNLLSVLKDNISKMLGQCNEAINKSKLINDNLADQANQFDTSANRTMTKVAQFENVLTRQSQNMELLAQNISDKSEQIHKTLEAQSKNLTETTITAEEILNKSISNFEQKSSDISSVSATAAKYIDEVVAGLDDKTAALNVMFRQQEADFYAYSDKVSENTNKMSEILQNQMKGIEESADKLFARLLILEEDTGRKSETVVANSQKSIQELAEIEKMLAEKHEMTEKTVESTINRFAVINEAYQTQFQNLSETFNAIKNQTNSTVENIKDGSEKLENIHQSLIKNNTEVWQKLDEQTKYMENMGIKLSSQSEKISDMLTLQRNNISEVVNTLSTQARLGEASLAQQYKYLTDATVDVAAKMQEINNDFQNHTGSIFEATNKMSYEFDVLGDRLLKACDAINKASKDSVKNIDQISLRLNQCSEDLNTTIYHSVENIGGVFNEYEKYLAGFNTITAETSTGVVEINNLISAQSDKMIQISDDTKKLVNCFNTVLNDTSNQLAERANDAYDKVRALGTDLKKLGMELDDTAKLSATHMEKSGDKLRASINEIAANAERISNTILSSGEVFVKQSQALTAMTDDTSAKINQSIDNLLAAGKAFEQQGDSIIKESIRFNDTVNTQTQILTDNTAKAEKAMQSLNTVYKDIKIDTFLKEAGSIISTLESISVDISRLLKPKDDEDLWKKFYNGDKQVFIRSISKNLSNTQIAALRAAFEKNESLRKQVNLYMHEFETLVEKSKNHEHSATLMAVISGADLGRLYYILAKALNKLN